MVKRTRQKEAILRVLRSTTSHPTAEWIFSEVRKEVPHISLGTVYRNLRQLRERGEILELDFNGAPGRFDANAEEHYHFRCARCERVFDVDEPVSKGLGKRAARETGFRISGYRLDFRGLCKECQKGEKILD